MAETTETFFSVELVRSPTELGSADMRSPSRFSSCVIIGRSTDCDVRIPHKTVSRRHVDLRTNGKQFIVTNLSSRGTTLVDHESLGPEEVETKEFAEFFLQVGAFLLAVKPAPMTEPFSKHLIAPSSVVLDISGARRVPVKLGGHPVNLGPIPGHVLCALASRPGEIVTFDDLLEAVGDGYGEYGGGNINQIISYIRSGFKEAIDSGTITVENLIACATDPTEAAEHASHLTRLMQYIVQNHYKRGYSLNLVSTAIHIAK